MLGGRRKKEGEGEGRHGQGGEKTEEEREGRGTKGGEREKRHNLHPEYRGAGLQNFHPVELSLLACMCYFLMNNCHLNLLPANSFCSDIYTSNNNVKMTIGYSTPILSHLSGAHVLNRLLRENWKSIPIMFNGKRLLNQRPMGHNAHLNVQL